MVDPFMKKALLYAKRASEKGEVPVGCVIVKDGKVIAGAGNARETKKNALHHAEILAIDKACKKLGGWRLWQCEMYVTMEPCPMCCGAILNSRIRKVTVAARDEKCGAMGSVVDLPSYPFNHHPEVVFGVMEEESKELLHDFFQRLRERKKLFSE